ncbi:MAG: tetratricopeptide repeat protein [Bacteroidetes bacterium]|nr:tetratricopeptide repeat protein [Bacteroidota bacterium]
MNLTSLKFTILIIILIFLTGSNAMCQNEADFVMKAKALAESGKTADALNILDQGIEKKATSRLFVQRAEILLALKDLSGATGGFNQANNIEEHSGDFGLAKVYALKGDASTSLYHLGMHLESGFKKSERDIMLEPAFSSIENRPEWRQFWKKERYNSVEKNFAEVESLILGKKFEDSKIILSEMKRNYPDNEETIYSEALFNIGSGKYSEAVAGIIKLTTSDPVNEKYLRLLAKAQEGQLNYAGASETYTKLLVSGVADARLLLSRAECFRKTKETEKALGDINRFLELYSDDRSAISLAGKVEAESGDNLKALEYFSKNLKLHPDDADCYVDRANSYFASKSWEWAARDYSMSLDLKPDNSDAWLNKGIALISTGNVKDACHDFKRSYALGNQRASSYLSKNCIGR